jgi:hypothetical protein
MFDGCCEQIGLFLAKPFSSLVVLTFLITFAPAIALFVLLGSATAECTAVKDGIDLQTWAIVQGCVCIFHFLMAIYIFRKVQVPQNAGDSFYKKLCHLVCEDVCMAFYICFLIFSLVWAILGSNGANTATTGDCSKNEFNIMIQVILTCTWAFYILGVFAFAYSALQGSIDDGACTDNCGYPCVWCGRLCCGDACCPTPEERAAKEALRRQRDLERGVPMRNPQQQTMNRGPEPVPQTYEAPPSRPAPVPVVYAQTAQPVPVIQAVPIDAQGRPLQQGQPKEDDPGKQAVEAASALAGAGARLAGAGLRMGANALFGKSKKNPKK